MATPDLVALRAPAHVSSDARDLWVADTGNHRVLGSTLDGEVHTVIGLGRASAGPESGEWALDRPLFVQPTGLAVSLDARALYVADRAAGAVWRVDRAAATARLVAGGRVSSGPDRVRVGTRLQALDVSLPGPAALALDESAGSLYLALAGAHQIWRLGLDGGALEVLAGDGAAGHRDGGCGEAAFCGPVGLALAPDRRRLYVADAGNRALRIVDLMAAAVTTLLPGVSRPAANGEVRGPAIEGCAAVVSSPAGLVIVDDGLGTIRGVNPRHATATPGLFDGRAMGAAPTSVTFDREHRRFVVADAAGHRLLRLTRDMEAVEELRLYQPGT